MITIDDIRTYCLAKNLTTESFPFDEDTLVFKVNNKMFALVGLEKWESGNAQINLKCDPEKAIELRETYPDDVFPGYHMSKKHWNTVVINQNLKADFIYELIDHSYEMVVSTFPKKIQAEILS
ncbi:MAG: MmcQ/YjbR family DNA-binding protein [Bacteroidota bacterium]